MKSRTFTRIMERCRKFTSHKIPFDSSGCVYFSDAVHFNCRKNFSKYLSIVNLYLHFDFLCVLCVSV